MINIIEYNSTYEESVKDLLVELQEYISSIDKEGYNIFTSKFRELNFKDTMQEINDNNGKIFLASLDNKIVGLIIGIIIEEENTYDFKAPKGGKVTELIVSNKVRTHGIGQALLNEIEDYFKSMDCKRVLIEVFDYNDIAKNFYSKNRYFNRLTNMMKKI